MIRTNRRCTTRPKRRAAPGTAIRAFGADERGIVSIVAAGLLLLVIAVAAIVIDAGSLLLARRHLQTVTDAAALAAVQNLSSAQTAAATVLTENGYAADTLSGTELGRYDKTQALGSRLVSTSNSDEIDAVRVSTQSTAPMYFSRALGFSSLATITAESTSAIVKTASIQAGSRLASLNSGIANAILGGLTGTTISLSAADYNGLLGTDIDTLAFLDALATKLNLSSTSTYGDLLNANATIGNILDAGIEVLQDSSNGSTGDITHALGALQTLSSQMPLNLQVKLGNFIDAPAILDKTIGTLSASTALTNVYSLTASMARSAGSGTVVNLTTGLSVPLTGSALSLKLAVGQAVQTAAGPIGTTVHTQQVRLLVTLQLADTKQAFGGLIGTLTATNISLPIYLEAAQGTGTIKSIPCTSSSKVVQTGTSGAVSLQFGTVTNSQLSNFSSPITATPGPIATVKALGQNVATISASGSATVVAHGPEDVNFSAADIDDRVSKTVPSSATGTLIATNGPGALRTSIALLPGTDLGALINPLLNAALSPFLTTVTATLTSALSLLDTPVNTVLDTLGLRLGEVDLATLSPRSDKACGTPILVE